MTQLSRILLAAGILAGGSLTIKAQTETADTIFQNGRVYTMNPKQEWAQAVAVKGKKIVYVGDDSGVAAFQGDATKVIDLNGRMLMPGFVEGHIHPIMGAPITRGADLQYNKHDDLMNYLRDYAKTAPDRGVIDGLVRGMGWRYSAFPLTGPTKENLDAIWPDVPVLFVAVDGHSAWVNSKALERIGVTKDTPPVVPNFSYFTKDPKSGEPTGYVVEGPAMQLALSKLGPYTHQFIVESMEDWLPKAAAAGITSIFDAGMPILDAETGFNIYLDLEKREKLPFRVVGSYYDNKPEIDPIPIVKKLRQQFNTELVQARVLKIMMDGVDSNGSAAMLAPYADNPKSSGDTLFSPYLTQHLFKQVDAEGIDIHVHCIGDRAARQSLDAFENAIQTNPPRDRRHVIAHNQLTDPADIPRFGKLGIIAEFSGQWACRDGSYWQNVTVNRWGPERASREYRLGSILRGGAPISLGTDWPAGSNSLIYQPLKAIQIATTRKDWDNPDSQPLPPVEDCLTLAEALRANTMGTAYQIRMEDKIGSLEVGKMADLIVLDRNLFDLKPQDIHTANVDLTMMNGRFTHGGESGK